MGASPRDSFVSPSADNAVIVIQQTVDRSGGHSWLVSELAARTDVREAAPDRLKVGGRFDDDERGEAEREILGEVPGSHGDNRQRPADYVAE
jgi:hypothetical protein